MYRASIASRGKKNNNKNWLPRQHSLIVYSHLAKIGPVPVDVEIIGLTKIVNLKKVIKKQQQNIIARVAQQPGELNNRDADNLFLVLCLRGVL